MTCLNISTLSKTEQQYHLACVDCRKLQRLFRSYRHFKFQRPVIEKVHVGVPQVGGQTPGSQLYLIQLFKMFSARKWFVLGFYCPVNNAIMSSQSVNSSTVPGQA